MASIKNNSDHPLQFDYTFWEHQPSQEGGNNYLTGIMEICSCGTVEDFWKCWNNILQPRDAFRREPSRKVDFSIKTGTHEFYTEVEALSIFVKGVEPKWEDRRNQFGCDLQIKFFDSLEELQRKWESLVLGIIGQTLDDSGSLMGARVVDKTTKGKPVYRFEIWFDRVLNDKDLSQMRSRIQELMGLTNIQVKPHRAH